MLNLIILNPIFLHLFINQILITIMGKYTKEFRSIKKRSDCIFKSFLICLFVISIVHMSESNVEDVTENTNLIETENLQSSEEKTEEPVKVMNQAVYFQGTEKSAMEQTNDEIVPASLSEMSSNSLYSFIPNLRSAANDDDDNEQNDAQESYLIDKTFSGSKGNIRILRQDDSMVSKLLRGNRMLTEQLQSNDKRFIDSKKTLIDDPSLRTKTKKLYLVDHLSEMKHIRGYLPNLMKLKRLVKKCQCSYRDEDEYSSIKDAIMPNRIDHRINLDYVDDESEEDDDERDDDDEPPMNNVLRQQVFNKYKRFDFNNFRDDDEDFERVRFNELKNVEEDKSTEENSLNEFEDNNSNNSDDDNSDDESVDEDEYDETEDDPTKDQNDDELGNNQEINEDKENEKLLSPFMTNLSPTSSSDIIFNELSMQTNQLDPNDSENEIQLAKLKRILGDGSLNTNNSDALKSPNDISTNPLSEDLASSLATQYSTNNSPGNRGNQHSGQKGKNKGNDRRNLFDHLILLRRRRQINKNPKNQLVQMKKGGGGGSSGSSGGKSNRN